MTRGSGAADEGAGGAGAGGASRVAGAGRAGSEGPPELTVQELPAAASGAVPGAATAAVRATGGGGEVADEPPPAARPGVSRLRVVEAARADEPAAGLEVWLDPTVRLRPAAIDALGAFEAAVTTPRSSARAAESQTRATDSSSIGSTPPRRATAGEQLAAARRHAGGAIPVRTVRSLHGPRSDAPAGSLEDVATRLEAIDALPRDLVAIPEGLRRVPHPAEGMLRKLEEEAEIDRALAGGGVR